MKSLRGRTLLFSEARQAIFELDQRSLSLWNRLELGEEQESILATLATADERKAIAGTLDQLVSIRDAELEDSRPRGREKLAASSRGLVLEVANVAVELDLPTSLTDFVEVELAHLKSAAVEVQARIEVREREELIETHSDGRYWSCPRDEFIPLLKGEVLDEVLRSANYEVALHAAALNCNGQLLLLCGSPGAGKTTLAIALTKAGFGLAADDVVLLDSDGCGTGVPLPLAAKSTSWPLVDTFYPDRDHRAHLRPDGQIVSYFLPESFSPSSSSREIGFVLFLSRQTGASAKIEDVDATDALAGLIAEGASRNEQLSTAGFEALVRALNQARCCRLTYDDLPDAVKIVQALCA